MFKKIWNKKIHDKQKFQFPLIGDQFWKGLTGVGGGLGVRWINSERALVVEINWGKHRCFINSKNYAQHSNIFLLIGVWKWVMIFWPNPTHYHCFFFWPNQTQPILNFSENDPNQPDPFWLKKFWPNPIEASKELTQTQPTMGQPNPLPTLDWTIFKI